VAKRKRREGKRGCGLVNGRKKSVWSCGFPLPLHLPALPVLL